jgi:hypothetical protein
VIIRAVEWKYYLAQYWAAPLVEKLFGLGIVQNANVMNHAIVPVDNEYLGILLDIGLVGFILMFWLQWKMWTRLYQRGIAQPSILTIAMAGFWSTFLSVDFYSLSLVTFSLIFIIALLAQPERPVGRPNNVKQASVLRLRSA